MADSGQSMHSSVQGYPGSLHRVSKLLICVPARRSVTVLGSVLSVASDGCRLPIGGMNMKTVVCGRFSRLVGFGATPNDAQG